MVTYKSHIIIDHNNIRDFSKLWSIIYLESTQDKFTYTISISSTLDPIIPKWKGHCKHARILYRMKKDMENVIEALSATDNEIEPSNIKDLYRLGKYDQKYIVSIAIDDVTIRRISGKILFG